MVAEREAVRQKCREALTHQPYKTITVLSSLLAVHDALGYLPDEAIEEVAEFTGSSNNDVWGVASFYTNFRFTPPGSHTVEVCWGPPCHIRGAMHLLQGILESLGLSNEGETPDGRISLRLNTCLGACSQAPVISVDHRLMGHAGLEPALQILDHLNGKGH